jgi:hypothetical protein
MSLVTMRSAERRERYLPRPTPNPQIPRRNLQRYRCQRIVLWETVDEGMVGGGNGAVGQRQAAVEFLAQQARLLARPFGGEQDVGQLGVAQQQAPVVVNEDDAQHTDA